VTDGSKRLARHPPYQERLVVSTSTRVVDDVQTRTRLCQKLPLFLRLHQGEPQRCTYSDAVYVWFSITH